MALKEDLEELMAMPVKSFKSGHQKHEEMMADALYNKGKQEGFRLAQEMAAEAIESKLGKTSRALSIVRALTMPEEA